MTKEEILKKHYEHHRTVVIPDENWAEWETCQKDGTTAMVYDAMEEYAALASQEHRDEWVSVEDRLPDAHIIDGKKKKLNWVLGTNGKNQFVCVYTKGHEIEYGDDDPSDEEYDEIEDNNGCLYLKPGWYELEETPRGEYDETWVTRTPTHWLPLPTPPTK